MNKLYKFLNIIPLLMFLLLIGCGKDDDGVFDETPQERKNTQIDKLSELISGSSFEGTYFPNNEKYGGSHMYFHFDGKGRVKMTSGFDEDTEMIESDYEIKYNSTVELNFSTYNHITKLVDNNLPDLRGTGFEGTNNFLFMGEEGDGSVLLRDPRNKSEILLNQMPDSDFDNSQEWADRIYQNQRQLAFPSGSVFQKFEIKENDGSRNFDFNFDNKRLYGEATEVLENGKAGEEKFEFGIAFTVEGLTLSPPIEYENQEIKEMVYDEEKDNFVGSFDGGSIILGSSDEPAFIPDDYKTIMEDYLRSDNTVHLGQKVSHGDSPITSAAFITDVREKVIDRFESDGYTFNYFYFYTDFNGEYQTEMRVNYSTTSGSTFTAYYGFTAYKIEDNKVYYSYDGPIGNNNGSLHEHRVPELIAFFESKDGLMFKYEGSFETDEKSYSNPSVSVTNMENPSQRAYLIVYP